jgi:CheY-specific phosphatase CheX
MEAAISQTVTAMWSSLFETEIWQNDSPTRGDTHDLVGCIHVTGPEGGVVTLECSEALAREIAATMFALAPTLVGMADAEDALGELANVVGGNFKAFLEGAHQLSLPTVVEGRDFRARFIGTELAARMSFDCAGERLVASFFRDVARATATVNSASVGTRRGASPTAPEVDPQAE